MTHFIGSPSGWDAIGALMSHTVAGEFSDYAHLIEINTVRALSKNTHQNHVTIECCLNTIAENLDWSVAQ